MQVYYASNCVHLITWYSQLGRTFVNTNTIQAKCMEMQQSCSILLYNSNSNSKNNAANLSNPLKERIRSMLYKVYNGESSASTSINYYSATYGINIFSPRYFHSPNAYENDGQYSYSLYLKDNLLPVPIFSNYQYCSL